MRTDGVVKWGVARIWTKRARRIVEEVGRGDREVFHPYYERQWISADGKPSHKTSALMPGYLFVKTDGTTPKDERGRDIEGLICVLSGALRDGEYERIRRGCDLGHYDDRPIKVAEAAENRPRKRRKPRPSKRARVRAAARRAKEAA